MKLNEILLEIAEKFNRQAYGSWVDSNSGKIYNVDIMGHHEFVQQHMKEWGIPNDGEDHYNDYYFNFAYDRMFVRAVHNKSTVIVSGSSDNLIKIAPIIMASAAQPDVKMIKVEKLIKSGERWISDEFKAFEIPAEKRELQRFIFKQ